MNESATLIAPATMRLERLLPGPVERVWAYLTESEKRATWLCGGEFELRVGGRVRLEFDMPGFRARKRRPRGIKAPSTHASKERLRALSHSARWRSPGPSPIGSQR
jgi:hypothetical protein